MHSVSKSILIFLLLVCSVYLPAQKNTINAIYSGIPWFDAKGKIVSAHGNVVINDAEKVTFTGVRSTSGSKPVYTTNNSADIVY